MQDLAKGKKIAIFGVPGAYTPTCSAKHVPGYVQKHAELKKKRVDIFWCFAANDPFVMAAWGGPESRRQGPLPRGWQRRLRKKLGLEFDLTARGMGTRIKRFSMLVDDGVVKKLNIEGAGKFEVWDAETMLGQLG